MSNNNLESLCNLPETIEYLDISNNQIRKIVRLPRSLTQFICSNNHLYELPYIPDTVERLRIENNFIKNLVNFPLHLKFFHCHHNNLPEHIMKYLINNKKNLLTIGFIGANTLLNIDKSKANIELIKKELMLNRDIICMHPNRVARLLDNNEISFDGNDVRMLDL